MISATDKRVIKYISQSQYNVACGEHWTNCGCPIASDNTIKVRPSDKPSIYWIKLDVSLRLPNIYALRTQEYYAAHATM